MRPPFFPLCILLVPWIGNIVVPGTAWGQDARAAESTGARIFPDVDRFGDPLPAGALARLNDSPIRVLELPSGREKFRLPHQACHPFTYAPAGHLVTAGRDGRIHVWSALGTLEKAFPIEGKDLQVLGVSKDGKEVRSVDDLF